MTTNKTIESAALIRDVERVLAEWRETMDGDDVRSSVVRGMTAEIRSVLYAHFVGSP